MAFDGPNTLNTQDPQMQTGDDLLNMLGSQVLDRGQMEVVMRLLSDIGNEEYRSMIMDMSATSSGRLPSYMREGAEGVDQSMARLGGSREYNMSASARVQDELEPTNEDVTAAMTILFEQGVSGEEVTQALVGVDPLDTRATMEAMAEVAENNGLTDSHPVIEATIIDGQITEAATLVAQQDAERLQMEQRLQQEMDNPYQVAGTDMNGPAASRPV